MRERERILNLRGSLGSLKAVEDEVAVTENELVKTDPLRKL